MLFQFRPNAASDWSDDKENENLKEVAEYNSIH